MEFDTKSHYNTRASDWDNDVFKLVPHLDDMLQALVASIPFDVSSSIEVMDLGCGTGLLTERVLEIFPNAVVTCVDISENMLKSAELKLHPYSQTVEFVLSDFYDFEFNRKYDLVVSSLALHHLKTDQDKVMFYKKIYDALNPKGAFRNLDTVLGSTEHLNAVYMEKWTEFLRLKGASEDFIQNEFIPNIKEEDHPAKLIDHLKWMSEVGFTDIDVVWKYFNFAVYGAVK